MAIKQKSIMTIKLGGKGTSHSRSEMNVRDLVSVIDEPFERGGTNEGVSPTEAAFSALVGCTNVIGHKCAQKLGVDIGHMDFTMEVDFDRRGVLLMEEVEVPFKAIRLNVNSDGALSQSELDHVGIETAKFCPLAKLYENSGTDLTVTWQKA
ncbi:MAG: putative redox protein [Candidatus Azotimanducaceae bacterium]|jgi:putative redox protein